MTALDTVVSGFDENATPALFAEDAVVKVGKRSHTEKEQIRVSIQFNWRTNTQVKAVTPSGWNNVTFSKKASNDDFRRLGVAPLDFTGEVVVRRIEVSSLSDSAEKPSVHPSRASEPVLSLTKERTEERFKSLEIFRLC